MIKKIILGSICALNGVFCILSPITFRVLRGAWFVSGWITIPLMIVSAGCWGYLFWVAVFRKPKGYRNILEVRANG